MQLPFLHASSARDAEYNSANSPAAKVLGIQVIIRVAVQCSKAVTSCCVQAGVFSSGGHYEESILYAGDAGFAPMSSAHYFKNVGSSDSYVVLIFNAGQLTNIEASALVANMPAEVSHCSCSQLYMVLSSQSALPWQPTASLFLRGCV